MIKVLVVSDSHGNRKILKKILELEEDDTSLFFDCGDSLIGNGNPFPFSTVRGNCDLLSQLPKHISLDTPLGNFYVTHGVLGIESLPRLIKQIKPKPDFILYGHTHIHRYDLIDECHCFNPGSVSLPRDGTEGTYLVIQGTNKHDITWEFKSIATLK